MSIDYAQIRERREQVEKAREGRHALVISEAQSLVDAYEESLNLDNKTWTDVKGITVPYVMAGRLYDEVNFRRCALNSIELNNDYSMSFSIATVVDDSPRGGALSRVDIRVSIKDSKGVVVADVGIGQKSKRFEIPVTDNKYKAACEEIKLLVLMSVNDSNLIFEEDEHF